MMRKRPVFGLLFLGLFLLATWMYMPVTLAWFDHFDWRHTEAPEAWTTAPTAEKPIKEGRLKEGRREKTPLKKTRPLFETTPFVRLTTDRGDIVIALYGKEAPATVEHFLMLVNQQFYNHPNMRFHRVVPGFVVQTGDPTGTGSGGSKGTISLEVRNRLSHKYVGVVAMARGLEKDSATSQFYITLAPQTYLDGKYAIFGQVVSGFDVLAKIQQDDGVSGITALTEFKHAEKPPKPEKKSG